jgi:hypothetical protein
MKILEVQSDNLMHRNTGSFYAGGVNNAHVYVVVSEGDYEEVDTNPGSSGRVGRSGVVKTGRSVFQYPFVMVL